MVKELFKPFAEVEVPVSQSTSFNQELTLTHHLQVRSEYTVKQKIIPVTTNIKIKWGKKNLNVT